MQRSFKRFQYLVFWPSIQSVSLIYSTLKHFTPLMPFCLECFIFFSRLFSLTQLEHVLVTLISPSNSRSITWTCLFLPTVYTRSVGASVDKLEKLRSFPT